LSRVDPTGTVKISVTGELRTGGDWKSDTDELCRQIETFARRSKDIDYTYSGLIDLDLTFDLVEARLRLALTLVRHADRSDETAKTALAREAAVAALLDLERMAGSGVSLDQTGVIRDDTRMDNVRVLMRDLLDAGGAPLFSAEPDPRKARKVIRILTQAFLRHAGHRSQDVEPGDEDIVFSDSMTLPVSQAALMVREEFIPALRDQLERDPGNKDLQRRLSLLAQQAEIFENVRFFPRARPVEIEPGLLTDTLVGFAPNGEPVVRMRIPVMSSTGNRHDRIREQVENQVIRSIAEKGFSPELDTSTRRSRSASSGLRGAPDDKFAALRTEDAFREVTTAFPFLARLDDPNALAQLVDLAEQGRASDIRRYLQSAAETDRNLLSTRVRQLLDGSS